MHNHKGGNNDHLALRKVDREIAAGNGVIDDRWYARAEVQWPVVVETFGAAYPAEVLNIGPAGAFIACSSPPRLGDTVGLVIEAPAVEKPLAVTARVLWSTRIGGDQRRDACGMGVRFECISDADREFISDVVVTHYRAKATTGPGKAPTKPWFS